MKMPQTVSETIFHISYRGSSCCSSCPVAAPHAAPHAAPPAASPAVLLPLPLLNNRPKKAEDLEAVLYLKGVGTVKTKGYSGSLVGVTFDTIIPVSFTPKSVYATLVVDNFFAEILHYLIVYTDDVTLSARVDLKGGGIGIVECTVKNVYGNPLKGIPLKVVRSDGTTASDKTDFSGKIAFLLLKKNTDDEYIEVQVEGDFSGHVKGNGRAKWNNGTVSFTSFQANL